MSQSQPQAGSALAKAGVLRYLLAAVREISPSTLHRVGVSVAQACNRVFTRMYHQVEVMSPPRLPRHGPAILVCNNVSGLDPLLVQSACPRLVTWMMAREYYDIRGLTWLFNLVDAIPVDRSGRDTAATRAALRALAGQRILGVFPEGRIETDYDLLPFQTGVAMMAIKTRVPVYPAYLDGTQRGREMLDAFMHPNRAILNFGPAIEFSRDCHDREALQEATKIIRESVLALRNQIRRT